ncbi:DUF1285 domain-containing protein [Fodinicurvata halophila]
MEWYKAMTSNESPAASSIDGQQEAGESPQPTAEDFPSCGDFDMRIARDGTWFYRGTPIGRMQLVKLFSTVLRREDDGTYWLVTPVERGRIEVEDAPFIAEEIQEEGEGQTRVLKFRTNVGDWVELDSEHPLRVEQDPETGEPRPYITVRNNLEARLARSVFYHLVELAVPGHHNGEEILGIWSKNTFFPLENAGQTTST